MNTALYIFSGLPGSGKTTLARELSRIKAWTYIRVDAIEQAMRDSGFAVTADEGYRVAGAIASENLKLGRDVVCDSCNPVDLTRRAWIDVAIRSRSDFVNIEVVCSSAMEHKARIEGRESDIAGLILPTWDEIQVREYDPWTADRLVIDTAGREPEESLGELLESLGPCQESAGT